MDSALFPAVGTVVGAVVGAGASYLAGTRQAKSGLELTRLQFAQQRQAEELRDQRSRLQDAYVELAVWLYRVRDAVDAVDALLDALVVTPVSEDGDDVDRLTGHYCTELRGPLGRPPRSAALAACLWDEAIEEVVHRLGRECAAFAAEIDRSERGGPARAAVLELCERIRVLIRRELAGTGA